MGRGTSELESIVTTPRARRSLSVSLFGGEAGGRRIEVLFPDEAVAVWESYAGELTALAVDAPQPSGRFLGIYEPAGLPGPEKPVFVNRLGARLR